MIRELFAWSLHFLSLVCKTRM